MRVLFCTGVFPPLLGGPATVVERLASALSKRGYQVTVLTYGASDNHGRPYRVKRILISRPRPWRLLSLFWQTLVLARRADVIYAFDTYSHGLTAALAAKILRKPLILRFTGDSAWETEFNQGKTARDIVSWQNGRHGLTARLRINRRNFILRTAKKIITDCRFLRELLIKLGLSSEKIIVINNAVDIPIEIDSDEIQKFREQYQLKGRIILTIGRLVPWKGIRTLIKIMPEILKEFPDLNLLIVGRGPQENELKQLADELGLSDKVKLAGKIASPELKQKIYQLADIVVLNTFYEGMSNVLLEAMAAGRAIVTTRAGGNPEFVKNANGVLVDYNNAEQIKEALRELLVKPEQRRELGLAAQDTAKRYSWNNLIDKNISVILNIASVLPAKAGI